MIDLYTWATPNGRKASIALEEMGLPYEAHAVDITQGEQHAPEFLKISPNNKIPAIRERETSLTLMESGAILIHLAETTGLLMPSSGIGRTRVIEWLMWQMGGFGPILGQAHQYLKFNKGKAPFAEERLAKEVDRLYGVLETQLDRNGYVTEEYSIADIAVWPWVSRFEWHGADLRKFPHVSRWYTELAGREAVRKGYHVPAHTGAIPMP